MIGRYRASNILSVTGIHEDSVKPRLRLICYMILTEKNSPLWVVQSRFWLTKVASVGHRRKGKTGYRICKKFLHADISDRYAKLSHMAGPRGNPGCLNVLICNILSRNILGEDVELHLAGN